jgi:hypothetical protein
MNCVGSNKVPNQITLKPNPIRHWLPGHPSIGTTGKGLCYFCKREIGMTRDGALMPHKRR